MKKVFIKYNPYKLETKITVDGKELKENSQIREYSLNTRIQEWIEELPTLLYEECNDFALADIRCLARRGAADVVARQLPGHGIAQQQAAGCL